MSESAVVEVRNYITEEVEEELYAGSVTIPADTTTPYKVEEGRIPEGHEGVAVSVACTRDSNIAFWLKIDNKQRFKNGLNAGGLGGLDEETLLLVHIPEGKRWEIGFTNTSSSDITVGYRFRMRLFRKG